MKEYFKITIAHCVFKFGALVQIGEIAHFAPQPLVAEPND